MAQKKAAGSLAGVKKRYRELDVTDDECASENLTVGKGDTFTVSLESEACKNSIRVVRPQTIDEVRKWLGPTVPIEQDQCNTKCVAQELQSSLVSVADLESKDESIRKRALGLAHKAAREYTRGNVKAVQHWKVVLSSYIKLRLPIIYIGQFDNITVSDGATLKISSAVQALYANKIEIHGSGQISSDGPLTINCTSVEGI